MITRQDIDAFRQKVHAMETPVVSLYLETEPGPLAHAPNAVATHAAHSMKEADVPKELIERIRNWLRKTPVQAKSLAVFATEDTMEVLPLQVSLPVFDGTTGTTLAHWGEPHTAPLWLALDEWERYGVVVLDRDRWRLFELYLGEIQEVEDAIRPLSPGEMDWYWDAREAHPAYTASRASSMKDDFARHQADRMHRFFKEMGHALDRAVAERGLHRLILCGPHDSTNHFQQVLPRPSRDRVVARLPGLANPDEPTARHVLDHVADTVEEVERRREAQLLGTIREEGLWGFEPCLQALQEGRLYVVAIPWEQQRTVYQARPSRWVAPSPEAAAAFAPGDTVEEATLRAVLPELAARYGAALEFVRGDNEHRLVSEFDGMAGLTRW
ncbi:MAG: VLRF1 family aeRF1-type release factor [Myxococcota bacterium]